MCKLKETGTWQAQKIPGGAKAEHLLGKDATFLLVIIFGERRLESQGDVCALQALR